jgi:hypothetical protein
MSEVLKQMVQNTITVVRGCKANSTTARSDNPEFRYVIGKDATMMLEARKNMSDRKFQNLVKKQFNL